MLPVRASLTAQPGPSPTWVGLDVAAQVKAPLIKFGRASTLSNVCRETRVCAVWGKALFIYSFTSFKKSRHGAPLTCDSLRRFYSSSSVNVIKCVIGRGVGK